MPKRPRLGMLRWKIKEYDLAMTHWTPQPRLDCISKTSSMGVWDRRTQECHNRLFTGRSTSECFACHDNIEPVFDALAEFGVGVLEAVLACDLIV